MILKDRSDLAAWLAHIEHSRPQHVIDLGLSRVQEVGEALKVLSFSCPVITVAGTNGKGSTVAVLATLLQAAGLNVGAYTSPHLLHFNERIQINGQPVQESALCDAFAKIEAHGSEKGLTFFEYTTLAAFSVFKESPNLDVIILEVGLGGRLDAVNVISPSMAIVTSISIDHEAILGATRSEIAEQKAGILRNHIPVILSKDAKVDTLEKAIQKFNNPVMIEDEDFGYRDSTHQTWHFQDKVNKLPKFNLPESSVSLALAAYTVFSKTFHLLPDISEVINYIENVTMMGRFQTINIEGVSVIFDVAHNPASVERLANKLKQHTGGKVTAVWASLKDKNLTNIVLPMINKVSAWFVGGLEHTPRAASPLLLEQALTANGVNEVKSYNTLIDAFASAKLSTKAGDSIVVFGSFYAVSNILSSLIDNKACQHYGLSFF